MNFPVILMIAAASFAAETPAGKSAGAAKTAAEGTTKVAAVGLSFQVPDGWSVGTPTGTMRKAQYSIPAPKAGGEPADLVLYFFGVGQGGGAKANLDRWVAQFAAPAGSASTAPVAKTDTLTVGNLKISTADVSGTYVAERMPGSGDRQNKPGWRLLGAVVEGPGGPWFFKMTGPEATVGAAESAYSAMLRSMKASG